MRGIPRQAVHANVKIKGTDVTARQVAHPYSICPWNTDMYGVKANVPGAQEYYDSIFDMYAEWNVDFVKVDDISYTDFGDNSYSGRDEIEMISSSIDRCGRDMVLSLSCGPSPIEHAEHLKKYSNMWRITADLWDRWEDIYKMFERCSKWAEHSGEGHWPDADMLPLGHISIIGQEHGDGERYSRLSHDEQITMLTLWCIARSPLMFGGECRDNDEFTLKLLTNKDVIRVNQHGRNQCQIYRGGYNDQFVVWKSHDENGDDYLAVFNTWNTTENFSVNLNKFGFDGNYSVTELWSHESVAVCDGCFETSIPVHGAKLFRLKK